MWIQTEHKSQVPVDQGREKNKMFWKTAVSREPAGADLRAPCSARMPAQPHTGSAEALPRENPGALGSLRAVLLHSQAGRTGAGKITSGSLPCKWVYSAFQAEQLRAWTRGKRNAEGCLQPAGQSDRLGWSHAVSAAGFIGFWKSTGLTV